MYAGISKTTSSARFEGLCARYRPDVFRFRKRHTTVPLDDLIANDDPALASVPSEDSDIGDAISSLDTDYRKPLVLQALMGYSTEEIARQMGLTRGAVLTRLLRARLKLRVALGLARQRPE